MKMSHLIIIGFLIILSGCENEEGPTTTEKECLITNVIREYDSYDYTYTSSEQLTQVLYKYGNGSIEAKRTEFQYQSGKILILETDYSSLDNLGAASLKSTATLNSSNFPTKLEAVNNDDNWKFVYTNDKLSYVVRKRIEYDDYREYDSMVVKFNSSGKNIIEETNYNFDFDNLKWEADGKLTYVYDDKSNPFKGLIYEDYIGLTQFFSTNNVILDTFTDISGSGVDNNTDSYAYTYNNQGYPITFSYGKGNATVYQYNCK
ncbi:MAG: hypothetical protein JNL53_20360 [Cyclobacteriaceae bacterium]|nr:hypothetical protein [Cyclobacteriaceae bacterium]